MSLSIELAALAGQGPKSQILCRGKNTGRLIVITISVLPFFSTYCLAHVTRQAK